MWAIRLEDVWQWEEERAVFNGPIDSKLTPLRYERFPKANPGFAIFLFSDYVVVLINDDRLEKRRKISNPLLPSFVTSLQ